MNTTGFIALVVAAGACLGSLGIVVWSGRRRAEARGALAMLVVAGAALLTAAGALASMLASFDVRNAYVVQHASDSMPRAFKLASFWAGQEGSLLLWTTMVAMVCGVLCVRGRSATSVVRDRTIAAAALMVLAMTLILLVGANPFRVTDELTQPSATVQQLRHWAMLIHPPLIFVGYALCAAPFILVAGGVCAGSGLREWMGLVRNWAMAAWIVLGSGITIGAWWAYTQLGWGGYWAWDPVENASLIPWLTLMALVHAAAVYRRSGSMAAWVLWLSLGTFILCAFGTFVTRGGLVQSIHSFGQSTIGWYLAAWIALLAAAAVAVIASGRRQLKSESDSVRAEALGVAGVGVFLLVLSAAAVLIGTATPMVAAVVRTTPVWIGRGFYETIVGPLAMAGTLLMVLAPMMNSTSPATLPAWQRPGPAIAAAILVTIGCRLAGVDSLLSLLCIWMSCMAFWFTIGAYLAAVRGRLALPGTRLPQALAHAFVLQRRAHGTRLAHLGIAILLMGVCASTVLTRSYDLALKVGEQAMAGSWSITLQTLDAQSAHDGPDQVVISATITCTDVRGDTWVLSPASRRFLDSDQTTADVAIRSTLAGDCFISLGEWDDRTGRVSVHVARLPGMIWIWCGAAVTALGGVLCAPGTSRRVVAVQALSTRSAGSAVHQTLAIPSAGAHS